MAARRPRSPAASSRGRDAASPRSRRKATGEEAKAGPKTERAAGASQSPPPRTRASAAKARDPAVDAEPLAPREVVAATPVLVGHVVHVYGRAGAARVALTGELRAGDAVAVRGTTTDFCARVVRLERRDRPVARGRVGEEIGVALPARVRRGDRVFRLEPGAP